MNKIKSFDKFGAKVDFNFKGRIKSGTLCGGLASITLQSLVLIYFCMRAIAVVKFHDPQVLSYTIIEDRSKMDTPINFGLNY